MKRVDELIRRSLDAPLGDSEARELLLLLRGNPAKAHALLEHQRLLEAAAALPRPRPSSDFTARTMARIEARAAPRTSLSTQALRPRLTLRLGLAHFAAAMMLGALAIVGGVDLARRGDDHGEPAERVAAARGPTLVRFTYRDPAARTVHVTGDFNDWDARGIAMRRLPGGSWEARIPIPSGRHQYAFVVDGEKFVPDPFAAELVDDGFGGQNSLLDL